LPYLGGHLPSETAALVRDMAADAEFHEFADAGHFLSEERPREWAEVVMKHFDSAV
jgi:pimeloyl-ACP methyl ester carboxylesterase